MRNKRSRSVVSLNDKYLFSSSVFKSNTVAQEIGVSPAQRGRFENGEKKIMYIFLISIGVETIRRRSCLAAAASGK